MQNRPIKRIYINFDKDIAHCMFGYRTKFEPEEMKSYCGQGIPTVYASQQHKPISHLLKEKISEVTDRYRNIEGYQTKQTIVRVLDSDKSEDEAEIERNRKMIKIGQRAGAN